MQEAMIQELAKAIAFLPAGRRNAIIRVFASEEPDEIARNLELVFNLQKKTPVIPVSERKAVEDWTKKVIGQRDFAVIGPDIVLLAACKMTVDGQPIFKARQLNNVINSLGGHLSNITAAIGSNIKGKLMEEVPENSEDKGNNFHEYYRVTDLGFSWAHVLVHKYNNNFRKAALR